MRKDLIEQEVWDNEWRDINRNTTSCFTLDKLVKKYLKRGGTFLEIGCAPGNNMEYFYKEFDYDVTGIDYAGIELTDKYLSGRKIPHELVNCDAFAWQADRKYDVVFSTGFIEHFDPLDPAIDIHKCAVEQNGFIVIVIPNLRYFNKFMAKCVMPEIIQQHNLSIMNPKVLKQYFTENSGFICHYCDYYKTSLLDIDTNYDFLKDHRSLEKVYKGLKKVSRKINLDNIPNRFFSPNIVVIAQKI